MNITDIYRIFYSIATEYTFFSEAHFQDRSYLST
jgi:hypothetical protein